jgi:hypothetical protein
MINRIIEAFTRPHYLVTNIDEVIMALTVVLGLVLILGIVLFSAWLTDAVSNLLRRKTK